MNSKLDQRTLCSLVTAEQGGSDREGRLICCKIRVLVFLEKNLERDLLFFAKILFRVKL
jgi:hypothetical protein